jgi:hypothetical protein
LKTKKIDKKSEMLAQVKDTRKKKTKTSKLKSASGTFVVTSLDDSATASPQRETPGFVMKESPTVACVEMAPVASASEPSASKSPKESSTGKSPKSGHKQTKKQKNKKRNDDGDDPEKEEKMSGKEKRRMYRQQKVGRIGDHFFDTANVKNRSYRS